jgi:hypothetical protein
MKNVLSKALLFFYTFLAVVILISLWLGYFWINSYLIFLLAGISTCYLYSKYTLEFEIPRRLLILFSLMVIMTAYPLLLIHPYVPASSDALHITISRVLGKKIPLTYAPYSDVRLTYPIGFHLFAKMLDDIVFFVPDYQVLWFLGVLFSSTQVLLLYFFASSIFYSRAHGEWAALLLLGTKTIFQNMYWGGYNVILATNLFLLFFVLLLRGNNLYYLFFPVIFAVHPIGGVMAGVFLMIYHAIYRLTLKQILLLPATLLLLSQYFFRTYYTVWINAQSQEVFPYAEALPIASFIELIVKWFGPIPFLFASLSLLYLIKAKKMPDRGSIFTLGVFSISFALYVFLYLRGYMHADKIFILVTISGLLLASIYIGNALTAHSSGKELLFLLVILLCISTFLASKELSHFRSGSKISRDEAEFAVIFAEYDSSLERVLFLTPGKALMSHISKKIPYDVKSGWFMPSDAQLVWDHKWREMNERREKWEMIYEDKCIECIYKLNVTYVIINKNYFNTTLKEKPVLRYKYFDVYKLSND